VLDWIASRSIEKVSRRFPVPTIVRSPIQHIDELRQAVDTRPAKKPFKGRASSAAVRRDCRLILSSSTMRFGPFGTEFKQLYFMGPHCFPLLEHWAEAVQLDGKRYDDHQRQGHRDQNDSD